MTAQQNHSTQHSAEAASAQALPAAIPTDKHTRKVPMVLPLVVFVIVIFLGVGFLRLWNRPPHAPVPVVDLHQSRSFVTDTIQEARANVVARPREAESWGQYGMCLYAHEFVPAALTCFEEAERLDSEDYRWPYLIGLCVTFSEPLKGAEKFERSAALRPDLSFVCLRTAELAIDLNRPDIAEDHIQEVLRRDSSSARAHLAAARLALQQDNAERAGTEALLAAQLAPDVRMPFEILARVSFQNNQPDKASEYLQRLQQATRADDWPDPILAQIACMRRDLPWALAEAQHLADSGKHSEAQLKLTQLVGEFPQSVEVRLELVRLLVESGQSTQARAVVEDGLSGLPDAARLIRMRGALNYQAGHKEAAITDFERAIELKPDFALAYFNLALCLRDLGLHERALQAFQSAAALRPNLPGLEDQIRQFQSTDEL